MTRSVELTDAEFQLVVQMTEAMVQSQETVLEVLGGATDAIIPVLVRLEVAKQLQTKLLYKE